MNVAAEQRIAELFGVFAPTYDQHMARSNHFEPQRNLILQSKKWLGKNILDFAAGTGANARLLRDAGDFEITCVDSQSAMLAIARATLGPGCKYILSDVHSIDLPDQSFDTAICSFGFFWFRNPNEVLTEISRLLRPKGGLIILEERFYSGSLPQPAFAKNGGYLSELASLEAFMHIEKLRSICIESGFNLMEEASHPIDSDHELVLSVFTKRVQA